MTTEKPKRVIAFVDGFNVYHFMDKKANLQKYKWLDYWKISNLFAPKGSIVVGVYYFTAFVKWDEEKVNRHRLYIKALRTKGVKDVIGKFKAVSKSFIVKDPMSSEEYNTVDGKIKGRHQYGYTFEEKQTDVNIATYMISKASQDEYDIALLFSGDTDFEPVIKAIKEDFPKKEVIVVVPNSRVAGSLRQIAGMSNCRTIKGKNLRKCQLEETIVLPSGGIITRPESWK